MKYISVGNGEKCPYCAKILDNRTKDTDIGKHLLMYHKKELLKQLFPEDNKKVK